MRSSWKLLNAIHNRYLLLLVKIHFKFDHFFEIISLSVISKKSVQYHCMWNLKQLRSSWKLLIAINDPYSLRVVQIQLKFEHFFDIISILFISKKSVQYHCRWNLNQLRSSWKLLNAIDDPYLLRVIQIHLKFEHFFDIISILFISKKSVQYHCRWNLKQLRSSWKLLIAIDDPYSLRVVQIHLKFEHFFDIISILVISKKSVKCHCRWNLNQLRSSWKLLNAIDDPYLLRVVQIHWKFEHFFDIISILVISKKSVQYHCRWNLKQLRSSWKLLIAIDDPYSLRVVQIHLKFEHFFDIISILVISKKSVKCHCRWNLNQLRSSWKLLNAIDDPYLLRVVQIHWKFEHFFDIISILVISKKSVQCHCRWNLKQLRSSWKLLNAIDDPYLLRVVQIHLKFEHFFDIISILVISKKSVQYHCRWNLNQLRSSRKLLNAIDDPYLLRVIQIHLKFEHFFDIISILVISKKSVKCHCRWNLNQLRSSWKLLNAIDDPYLLRVVQIHWKFEHFFDIISILVISKKSVQCHCRWNLKQLRSSWKLLNAIDDPYLLRVVQIHLKFEHFFDIISILVISKKSVQYHCRWNLNQLRSSRKLLNAIDDPYLLRVIQIHLKFEHFFDIISILVISKKSVQCHCRWNLNQLRSSWKLLNAIDDPYLLRVIQIHLKFEHFFDIISILVISKKSVQCHCRWNLKQLRSSWKLLNAIDDPYLLRVVQIHLKFEHFFDIISILVISKKSVKCHCRWNLNQLRSSWKLLNAIDDPYLLRVVQIHWKFEHFFDIISILVISKKSVQYHCRWNLNQLRSSRKLLNAIDDPYLLRVIQIHLKFEHFFDIISILVISKKSVQYHCRWNLNQLRSSRKLLNAIDDPYLLRVIQIHLKFEHFFDIISILVISKKSVQCHCRWNLNQLRSSWKLLNAIDDPYLLRVIQIHLKFEHFFDIISILVISKKSVQCHCRWNLKQLRSSWKLLNAIDDPYLLRVVQIHWKFEHFFDIISILFISKKSVQYHCRWNLKQLRSSWKLLIAIDDPYSLRVVQIHFKFEHFSEVISISVISKKINQI